jgi:hypothetical protein
MLGRGEGQGRSRPSTQLKHDLCSYNSEPSHRHCAVDTLSSRARVPRRYGRQEVRLISDLPSDNLMLSHKPISRRATPSSGTCTQKGYRIGDLSHTQKACLRRLKRPKSRQNRDLASWTFPIGKLSQTSTSSNAMHLSEFFYISSPY